MVKVNAQKWLDQNYPSKEERKKITVLNLEDKDLEGILDLSDFTNLEKLNCSLNELSDINLSQCSNLIYLNCSYNLLDDLGFLSSLPSPEKLTLLNINDCGVFLSLEEIKRILASFNLKRWREGRMTFFRNSGNVYCCRCSKCIEEDKLAWFGDARKNLDFCSEDCCSDWKELSLSLQGEFHSPQNLLKENNFVKKIVFDSDNLKFSQSGELIIADYPNLEEIETIKKGNVENITKIIVRNCPQLQEVHFHKFDNNRKLEIIDCPNLKTICCKENNKLTELILPKNPNNLQELICRDNLLTDLDFSVLNSEKITSIDLRNNNFSSRDLSCFNNFTELERLEIGNHDQEKIKQGIYNRFYGSLKFLENMNWLEILCISDTDVNKGTEYLPRRIITESYYFCYLAKERPESKVKEIEEELSEWATTKEWKKVLTHKKQKKFIQQWQVQGFTQEEYEEWIKAEVIDVNYAVWLRDVKKINVYWILNNSDKGLRKEYRDYSRLSVKVFRKIKEFEHSHDVNKSLTSEQELLINQLIPNQILKERYKEHGLCQECQQPNIGHCRTNNISWCQDCSSRHFKEKFDKWTSGNLEIDKFIKECQLETTTNHEILEWIPYEQFENIEYLAEGGFGKVYKAKWIEGSIKNWNVKGKDWERKSNTKVALKVLHNSQNISTQFLSEITNHELFNNHIGLVKCYGISQDPETKNYVMVTQYIKGGNLRQFLKNNSDRLTFEDKLSQLVHIVGGLDSIHHQGLVHKDFHPGNVLVHYNLRLDDSGSSILNHIVGCCHITDLGLCRPVDETNKGKIFGELPYVAPEILEELSKDEEERKVNYTQASDVYSFGIIAYELLANSYPYLDFKDLDKTSLILQICYGLRPDIDSLKIPQLLKELIKECWNKGPEKRPVTCDIKKVVKEWSDVLLKEENTNFYQQYKEIEEEYDHFSQNFPYQIHSTKTHSKLINTKQIVQLFQESKEQALELEIKKIEQEINQLLTDELKELVSNFLQTYKKRERGNKEVTKKDIKNLKDQLRAEKLTKKDIEKIVDYCSRLVKLEQQQEQLQAQVEVNTNNILITNNF